MKPKKRFHVFVAFTVLTSLVISTGIDTGMTTGAAATYRVNEYEVLSDTSNRFTMSDGQERAVPVEPETAVGQERNVPYREPESTLEDEDETEYTPVEFIQEDVALTADAEIILEDNTQQQTPRDNTQQAPVMDIPPPSKTDNDSSSSDDTLSRKGSTLEDETEYTPVEFIQEDVTLTADAEIILEDNTQQTSIKGIPAPSKTGNSSSSDENSSLKDEIKTSSNGSSSSEDKIKGILKNNDALIAEHIQQLPVISTTVPSKTDTSILSGGIVFYMRPHGTSSTSNNGNSGFNPSTETISNAVDAKTKSEGDKKSYTSNTDKIELEHPTTRNKEEFQTQSKLIQGKSFTTEVTQTKKMYFTDLGKNGWARESIEFLHSKGITVGTAVDKFSPTAKVTFSQMVVFLQRLFSLNLGQDFFEELFPIPKKDYVLTKQDAIVMMQGAMIASGMELKASPGDALKRYADADKVRSDAEVAISSLLEERIISSEVKYLNPTKKITREELAVCLKRVYDLREIHHKKNS